MKVIFIGKLIDLTGKRFGKLTVLYKNSRRYPNGKLNTYWNCMCDCGNRKIIRSDILKSGRVVSCGCYSKEVSKNVIPVLNWKTNHTINLDNIILIKSSNTEDYFMIDKEDYDKVKNYCWCSSHGYAVASIRGVKGKYARMHRIIMNCGETEDLLVVDHINHNTLDNRKCNLRIATNTQNNWNSERTHNSGIRYNATLNKWGVSITYKSQTINLGVFDSYMEALDIRDKAEKVFFEEFQYKENE